MSSKTIQIYRNDEREIIPSKAYKSDTGYDLTAIDVFKQFDSGVVLFRTGLIVIPPKGYYIEILPRSSISKTGWMLANSVGVIDNSYRGELYIAAIKINKSSPDLKPPFCKFQIVLRKLEETNIVEVKSVENTLRGSGGFGSTG